MAIAEGNLVYVTSGYNAGSNLFKVTPNAGKFSVEQVYANRAMANHHGGVVKVGEYLYGYSDSRGLACQNFRTGEIVWTAGIGGALLWSYIMEIREPAMLIILAGWLACAFAYGVYVSRRRRLRAKLRPPEEPIDRVTPLRDLQSFLADARQRGVPVYYYWSL
ncbi:MAG: hypothetical protein M1376_20210 [Planctomycetes bacterium]|nr:hypothetical protein [Planctomycetota bacterium]